MKQGKLIVLETRLHNNNNTDVLRASLGFFAESDESVIRTESDESVIRTESDESVIN